MIRDGRIGPVEQTMIRTGYDSVKGFETAIKEGLLQCNVKFIFEGEEEIGSPSLEDFCRENKELLKADVILVSDTSMVSAETPSLTTGLRGLAYWEIEIPGPEPRFAFRSFWRSRSESDQCTLQIDGRYHRRGWTHHDPGFL